MPKGIYKNKESELNRKIRMRNLGLSRKGKSRSEETKDKVSKTRKRLFKEDKIPRTNSGCFKVGMKKEEHPMYGKHHSEDSKEKMKLKKLGKHFSKETIDKMRKTKKRLFEEGKLKGCFKKNHIPHGAGKTKENYEPLKKAGEKISKTKSSKKWKEIKGIIASKKMSATKQGIPLEKWEKFISFEPYDKSFNNKFRRAIRKRDNYICVKCGVHQERLNKALNVHHINYDKKCSIPQNCISLCRGCHSETNSKRKHWTKFFQSLLSEKYNYQYSENQDVILNFQELYHEK